MEKHFLLYNQYTLGGRSCGACTVIAAFIARLLVDGRILDQYILKKAFSAGIILWNKVGYGEYMGLDQVKEHFHRFLKGIKWTNIMVCCVDPMKKPEKTLIYQKLKMYWMKV
mgnify:CR=1 FL=1